MHWRGKRTLGLTVGGDLGGAAALLLALFAGCSQGTLFEDPIEYYRNNGCADDSECPAAYGNGNLGRLTCTKNGDAAGVCKGQFRFTPFASGTTCQAVLGGDWTGSVTCASTPPPDGGSDTCSCSVEVPR